MAIFAISDLHLSFSADKPMDVFGWNEYEEKIKKDWQAKVTDNDLVLLPGDFSWSMNLADTVKDFSYLNDLPGKKLLLKGNHDYWWTTLTQMRKFLIENGFSNIDFLHNNSYTQDGYTIVGTRGWILAEEDSENKKIVSREVERLKLSLQDGMQQDNGNKMIACMHYPPMKEKSGSEFTKVLEEYPVQMCIYGHLHGKSQKAMIEGEIRGIDYKMVSCDYTGFQLIQLD